jgi:predicted metallopeptidase
MDIPTQKNITVVNEFNGKFRINESYRPIAAALIKKYPELKHIAAESILFVEDTESLKKAKSQTVFAQIGTIPEKWSDIVYQTSGQPFEYLMEIYRLNTMQMSQEQIVALIYHELRHIGTDGKIIDHEINDWINMVEKLGVDWNVTKGSIPDLLDVDVDWESITGPATLFPAESTLKLVK